MRWAAAQIGRSDLALEADPTYARDRSHLLDVLNTNTRIPEGSRLWRRGEPLAAANTLFEAGPDDMQVTPYVLRGHDFEAVAADIERRGFSSPKQLGIVGASNGGLLVSTVMFERPDLLAAVVCQCPLIDMLRYTHYGAGASSIGEYGDPADPKMAAYIRT